MRRDGQAATAAAAAAAAAAAGLTHLLDLWRHTGARVVLALGKLILIVLPARGQEEDRADERLQAGRAWR